MGTRKVCSLFNLSFLLFLVAGLTLTLNVELVGGWSNGGFSSDPSNPDYGTHDWIAQHALDWLPLQEKQYIMDNLAAYLYGTELPDNAGAPDGIGDTTKHHIYYNSAEIMTDDASALRASTEYTNTLNFLKAKDYAKAAKNAGIMSHYIVDVAVFGHVMGAGTDWGNEVHHSDYETYVNERTSSYNADFDSYLSFDGSLTVIPAYDAAKDLAYDTTFDVDGDLTCVWMDQNYNWTNSTFKNRAGESLNLAVNYLTDVLHTVYLDAKTDTTPPITAISLSGVFGYDDWFKSDVTITLSATDDTEVDKTEYSFNNATWITFITPFTVANEGQVKVYYKSTDKAGNSETIRTKTTKIDKTIPSGSIIIKGNANYTNSTSVTLSLTAVDATSGAYRVRLSNDGIWDTEQWETPLTTKTWTLLSGDGTKTVYYQIEDNAGQNSTYSDTIILDTTLPIANAGQNQTANTGATVTLDAGDSTDNMGITNYEWNFGDGTAGTGKTSTHTYTTSGTYMTTLTVKDAAGNSATDSITITVLSAEAFPMWIVGAAVAAITIIAVTILFLVKRK